MFGSVILDVAAGLVLVYLVLALVCTSVNEYIAQILSLRAEVLCDAIKALFQNSYQGKAFVEGIYNHNLVDALSPPVTGAKPSYIPSQVFSLALLDKLGIRASPGQQESATPPGDTSPVTVPGAGTQQAESAPSAATPSAAPPAGAAQSTPASGAAASPSAAPTSASKSGSAAATPLVTALLDQALANKDKTGVDEIIVDTLRPLAQLAGRDVDRFRKSVESWFDAAMERASGTYKRKVQAIILWVAFGVALVANADSLMLVDTLWRNPSERAVLAGAAKPEVGKQLKDVKPSDINLTSLVGWTGPILPSMRGYDHAHKDVHRFPDGLGEWLFKLLGLAITAFAASLGAPFWFGVLGKIVNIRSSGTPPTGGSQPPNATPQQPDRTASQGAN